MVLKQDLVEVIGEQEIVFVVVGVDLFFGILVEVCEQVLVEVDWVLILENMMEEICLNWLDECMF